MKKINPEIRSLKLTTARKAILEILHTNKHPLSYEGIKSQLAMNKATFYRNIANLKKKG